MYGTVENGGKPCPTEVGTDTFAYETNTRNDDAIAFRFVSIDLPVTSVERSTE